LLPGVAGEAHHVVHHVVLDVNVVDERLHGEDLPRLEQGAGRRSTFHEAAQHPSLVFGPGIAHQDADEEAIDLCLGQRIGPRLLHRVLGGEHDEGRRERAGVALDGGLLLLHRLEEGALWVLAGARLISSPSSTFVKMGPSRRENVPWFGENT
jgi:hypothetical protein